MLSMRIGIGHDTHRMIGGTAILLGGVRIPCEFSLAGHSDADVLLHAVTDALLGAAGMGDIGDLFSDKDPANQGRDSAEMLLEVFVRIKQDGWKIVNLDCIIFAETPKLGHHKLDIKLRLAELLEVSSDRVNVKAKTGEKIGIIGRCEAISAQCVVLLTKQQEPKPKMLEMAHAAETIIITDN